MHVNFTLDDLTKTLENWRREAIGDATRLRRLANQVGHDLKTPVNYVSGFCNLILSEENLSEEQITTINNIEVVVNNYQNSLGLMNSFITRSSTHLEPDFSVLSPNECAMQYLTSVDNLSSYLPFLEQMFENGPITNYILEYSPHIDTGLKQIVYSANKFFAPVRDNYRIDVDIKFLLKEQMDRFTAEQIHVDNDLDVATFKEDYVGSVVSYLLNNVFDHAFKDVTTRQKSLIINGVMKNNQYNLTLEDNGTGIDTNLFPNPNEIFGYRKSRRAQEGEDHGKGLYLVKEFVEEHGGSITVENNSCGEGAKFFLELPKY